MKNKIKLNTMNSANSIRNITCSDLSVDQIDFPFNGLFLTASMTLVLIVNGSISKTMKNLSDDDVHTLLYENYSLR